MLSNQQRKQQPKAWTRQKPVLQKAKPVTVSSKPVRAPLQPKELLDIAEQCRKKWEWDRTRVRLKDGQIQAIKAQLQGLDVVVHAATGYGKTCIAAGPYAHPKAKGMVTIMVSPLIALQEEMVETFRSEYKIKAMAVNSSHGGCTQEALQKIVSGEHQIILISPELLLSKRFLDHVMRDASFTRKLLSVIIDEAHVISHWGAEFRKLYGSLGMIRAFLPRHASVVAMSATLSGRVRNDVLSKLQFGKDYVNVDVGNDRPNVSLVVRAIEHPLNSYKDLDFVIPASTAQADDVPLTWIYADNITTGIEIEDHLAALLPRELRDIGLIRPYNAAYSKDYRAEVMRLVREGKVRVLICTDAAGMGCNIPNIDVVVQWKLPASLSSFIQRAGRAARQGHRQGLAVLLVERSAYETDLWGVNEKEGGGKQADKRGRKKKTTPGRTRAQTREYAHERGALRGSTKKADELITHNQPPIDPTALDEGLLVLVQTTMCRRLVLKDVYSNNNPINCIGPCCDICHPDLLNRTRPGTFRKQTRRSAAQTGIPAVVVQEQLSEWRTRVKKRDFPGVLWSPEALLQRSTMVLLSSVGPIRDRVTLDQVLAGQWKWAEKYADELLECLKTIEMPALQPKPKAPRKRKAGASQSITDLDAALSATPAARSKRARTTDSEAGSTAAATRSQGEVMVGREQLPVTARVASHSLTTTIPPTPTPARPLHVQAPPATPRTRSYAVPTHQLTPGHTLQYAYPTTPRTPHGHPLGASAPYAHHPYYQYPRPYAPALPNHHYYSAQVPQAPYYQDQALTTPHYPPTPASSSAVSTPTHPSSFYPTYYTTYPGAANGSSQQR